MLATIDPLPLDRPREAPWTLMRCGLNHAPAPIFPRINHGRQRGLRRGGASAVTIPLPQINLGRRCGLRRGEVLAITAPLLLGFDEVGPFPSSMEEMGKRGRVN